MANPKKTAERILVARRATLALVLVAVLASLAFDSGIGTPSAFGVGQFSLLCPLGGLEAMVASKAFIPVAAISAGVVLVFSLLFGRAWCAWGCPAPVIRRFFKRDPKQGEDAPAPGAQAGAGAISDAAHTAPHACALGAFNLKESLAFVARDSRTWVFAAVLAAALVAGLPLFCLVCPIGLTFGTVGSLWHLIVDKQMTLSVVVFPAALVVELVLYRKWCMNLCPVAGLLGILGQFARFFRPRVDASTCRHAHGCDACAKACPEQIDLHSGSASLQLGLCTRCGECAKACPTSSIAFLDAGAPKRPGACGE